MFLRPVGAFVILTLESKGEKARSIMSMSLEQLREAGRAHLIAHNKDGFTIQRRCEEEARAFNALAREALDSSRDDFVAFPSQTDRLDMWGFLSCP